MTKPVILTGIRANNDTNDRQLFWCHAANDRYGKNERSDEYQINLFIPGSS